MANRFKIEFDGFDEVVSRLTKLEGDVKGITEKALKKTHSYVTDLADEAIKNHKLSGDTEKSLVREANIEWAGSVASVPAGFSIRNGGLASIFLIYGTPRHAVSNQYGKTNGTARGVTKDQKLYTALSGKSAKTKAEVKKIQEDIFYEELRKLGG